MSVHSGTGFAPFELANGYLPYTPLTQVLNSAVQRAVVPTTEEFLRKVHDNWQLARECLQRAQFRQKSSADKKRRPDEENIKIGDLVWILAKDMNPKHIPAAGPSDKYNSRWIGPFPVEWKGKHAYAVSLPNSLKKVKLHNVFHT